MPATFPIPLIVVIPGQLIAASLWNNEWTNIYNNFIPAGVDGYSQTDVIMQTQTDPYPGNVVSHASSLAGELERLRFTIAGLSGKTYWYQPPTKTNEALNTFDLNHTHTGTTDGTNIPTAGLANLAVTTAKIAAAAVDETKIAASVAGHGLVGGAGSPLDINYDGVTLDVQSDILLIKDLGVSNAKLAANAVTKDKISELAKFTANVALVQSNVTGDGTLVTVIFGNEILDVGSNFNPATGIFTAPLTGNYLFSTCIFLTDCAAGNKVELLIVTTARNYASETWPTSNISPDLTVIAPMTAGDTAKVQVRVSGGSKVIDIQPSSLNGSGTSWFSGSILP